MTRKKFLDYAGLQNFLNKLKSIIPTKTSELQNDSGFITAQGTYDDELSSTSEQAVQNKVVKQALDSKADDSSVVHNTGNETVEGSKTFTSGTPLRLKTEDVEISTIPSATSDNAIRFTDKNNTIIADVKYSQYPSGNSEFGLNLRTKDTNNNTISKSVILNADQNGTWYNFRPSDNSEIGLGNSNYRWKSVYADNYYKGTTAFGDIVTHDDSEYADASHTHTASEVSGLATVATSGSYNDLSNKPAINDKTLTIKKNGTSLGTFTANSSTDETIDITVPTKVSDLTNDSGFLTSHNPVDSDLSGTSVNAVQNKVVKSALDGKSDTGHTHVSADITDLSIPSKVSDLTNDSGFITGVSWNDVSGKPSSFTPSSHSHGSITNDGKLGTTANKPLITGSNGVITTGSFGTSANTFCQGNDSRLSDARTPVSHTHVSNDITSLDASKLTGTIDIARLPKGALERLVTVADQTARFALTSNDVQLGDTVKQLDTGVMYIVSDESKLSSADGYTEYTAGSATSVPWSGVTGKPSSYTPASHTHGNVTNDGKLGTASKVVISDSNKKITTSSVSDTELGYLSGVTSAIQTQISGKANASHTHSASDITSGLATVATSGSYNDLSNKPTIPTVNNATLTIQKNGTTVKTFTANASSNVTANITVPTKVSELTNDSGFLTSHNPVDSALSDTSANAVQNKAVKGALDGKSDTGHTHTKSEITDFPTLATVATSGSYNDLSNKPTIPTVNNATLTIQKNGTTVKTFTANASSNVTANITVPTKVSELTNDSGFLTSASNLDSSKLTGTIDIARLPKGALERLVTVADQTARFALTTSDVQLGDTVKQLDTGVMYIVTDESKLSSADGYTEYTAGAATSVPWSGVTGKPSSYTPASHSHGNIANGGTLGTASRALITDGNKKITTSSVTSTELGYLSGVTSNVQTQLNAKADDSGVVHKTGNETISGTKTFSNTINLSSTGTKNFSNTNTSWTIGESIPSSQKTLGGLCFADSANANVSFMDIRYDTNGNVYRRNLVRWRYTNGQPATDGTRIESYTDLGLQAGGIPYIYTNAFWRNDLSPQNTNSWSLGDSNHKWKNIYADNYYLGATAFGDIITHNASDFSASGHTHTASDVSGLATVATSGSYNDLSNKPTIPTVNNATLTIQKNGTTVKTFTANASSNVTANITVPTKTSDLTNDSHQTITVSTDTTSTASPAHSGTFTCIDSVTRDSNGHVTKVNTKTITLPSDNNTDTKVTQNVSTANENHPILLTVTKDATANQGAKTSIFASGVKVNPSTNTVTATTFSGALSGNAATANKLATARSIALGNELAGSANFDGSGNITVNANAYLSVVGVGNKNNYPYHRFAYFGPITTQYTDAAIRLQVARQCINGGSGILEIEFRTNATNGDGDCDVRWIVRSSKLPVDCIQIGFFKTWGGIYADVFCKSSGAYDSYVIRSMGDGSRGSYERRFTLQDSSEANNTTTSDPLTSVNSYASIAAAGTALHNQAYTDILTATDAGVVETANTCSGNAATASKVVATVANDNTGALVQGTMGSNDCFRIAIGGASNAGWAEIATGDDYNEPIYVRQYQGSFATLKRTATLLDASGNTAFPGTVTATGFSGPLTGNVTGNCSGSSGSCTGNSATATQLTKKSITTANYEMNKSDFTNLGYYAVSTFKSGTTSAPAGNNGDYHLISLNNGGNNFNQFLCMTPRRDSLFYGHFWDGTWQGWREVATVDTDQTISGNKTFTGTLTGTLTGNCSGSSGSCTGNAATATQFSANQSVTLTGDVTGTASSKAGWSVATTLANSGVTAGTYGPSADVTGNNNATISVPQITVDAKGRVTSVTNRTLTCKNNTYTVNNATLTIQKNGTNVATFTSNASANATANITVPTKVSELTNDSGYLTSHQSLSNYVTLDGTQTISGAKTFSSNLVYTSSLAKKHSSITKGTNPSSTAYWTIGMCDKDGLNAANNALGMFETSLDKNGIVSSYLRAYKNTAGSNVCSEVRAKYNTTNDTGWINCTGEDICLISNKKTQGTVPTANQDCTFKMFDNSSHTMFEIRNRSVANSSTKQTYTTISVAPNTSGAATTDAFRIYAQTDNSSTVCNVLTQNFLPISNNTYALGDSSHKWKTAHAVNFYENGTALSSKYALNENFGKGTTTWLYINASDFPTGSGASASIQYNNTVDGTKLYVWLSVCNLSSILDIHPTATKVSTTTGQVWRYLGGTVTASGLGNYGASPTGILGLFRRES